MKTGSLASALPAALFALAAAHSAALGADPNGSRYDNWAQNAVWLDHYGLYTDSGWVSSKYPRMFGDVNGDGMNDVVAFGENGVYVGISNGTSFIHDSNVWSSGFGYAQGWRVGTNPRFVEDMNGDGKADLIGFGTDGVYVALSTGTSFNQPVAWTSQFGSYAWGSPDFILTLADVNGDHHPDAVGFGTDGVYVGLGDPSSNKFDAVSRWIDNFGTDDAWNNSQYVRLLGDLNGDGKADIIGYGIQGTWVSVAGTSSFGPITLVTDHFGSNQGWNNTDNVRTVADVNGDGKMDLVGFANSNVFISISPGTVATKSWPYTSASSQFTKDAGWTVSGTLRLMSDVNGDGKADIVGFNAPGMQVALATGQGGSITFSGSAQWVNDFGSNQAWEVAEAPRFMVDVNGDGRPEPAGYGYYGVYVSPSASLYCCDQVSFLDTGNNNQQVNGAWVGRTYLPRTQLVLNAPNNPSTCQSNPTYKNPLEPAVSNGSFGKVPWSTQYSARLMMNANFFDINSGNPNNPSVTCTTALGWTIGNTQTVSSYATVHGAATQTMAFFTPAYAAQNDKYVDILGNNAVSSMRTDIQNAISGFTLLSDGSFVTQPSGIDPNSNRARAGVGVTSDGKTMIMVVVNAGHDGGSYPTGGTTLCGLADFLKSLGANQALTLDGSGSAQLGFSNGAATYKSVGSDSYGSYSNLYRAVPVFIGVR